MEPHPVRRCRHCQAPAVIIVTHWSARLLGVLPLPHGGRTDHQCQACGARFTLRPWLRLWFAVGMLCGLSFLGTGALAAIGVPIALAVQGAAEALVLLVMSAMSVGAGVATLWFLAGPQVHAWRNPVVPGAPMPELRHRPLDAHRRCHCGAAAPRIRQTAYMIVQMPGGTSDTHQCPTCGHSFTVPNRWALDTSSAMALFLWATAVFLALLLPFRDLNGNHFFVLGVLGLGGLVAALLVVIGIVQRSRHPIT
jgi:ribosomal protein L37AE/L43A